jgi:hypothetical protein
VIQNMALSGYPIKSQIVHVILAVGIGAFIFRRSDNERLHYIIAVLLFIIMVISLITVRESLVIGD